MEMEYEYTRCAECAGTPGEIKGCCFVTVSERDGCPEGGIRATFRVRDTVYPTQPLSQLPLLPDLERVIRAHSSNPCMQFWPKWK